MNINIVDQLQLIVSDLLYPSESDEPFEPFVWEVRQPDALKEVASRADKTAPIEEQSVDDFFCELVVGPDGDRFKNLREFLETRLSGLRVIRVGKIEVGVYLIGKTRIGEWAGLRTRSIET